MTAHPARTLATVAALTVIAVVAVAHIAGDAAPRDLVGAVYTMTNDPHGNAVVAFDRYQDGRSVLSKAFSTGGLGTGGGLGSQGSLTLSDDGRWLFAVNAGRGDVSVFAVHSGGLMLAGRYASGGDRPISVTQSGDSDAVISNDDRFLYVLTGRTPPIRAFRVGADGALSGIGLVGLPASHVGLAIR